MEKESFYRRAKRRQHRRLEAAERSRLLRENPDLLLKGRVKIDYRRLTRWVKDWRACRDSNPGPAA